MIRQVRLTAMARRNDAVYGPLRVPGETLFRTGNPFDSRSVLAPEERTGDWLAEDAFRARNRAIRPGVPGEAGLSAEWGNVRWCTSLVRAGFRHRRFEGHYLVVPLPHAVPHLVFLQSHRATGLPVTLDRHQRVRTGDAAFDAVMTTYATDPDLARSLPDEVRSMILAAGAESVEFVGGSVIFFGPRVQWTSPSAWEWVHHLRTLTQQLVESGELPPAGSGRTLRRRYRRDPAEFAFSLVVGPFYAARFADIAGATGVWPGLIGGGTLAVVAGGVALWRRFARRFRDPDRR
jgi:hypothetical protein